MFTPGTRRCIWWTGFALFAMFALTLTVCPLWLGGCARHDVGREDNNPAPSSALTLVDATALAENTWTGVPPNNRADRRYSVPTPTSSMVPYLDSHSVLLLETVKGAVRIHDILVIDEGRGRENVCHQVMDLRDGYAYIEGKNNQWPDGWLPLTAAKWRVAGILYTRG